MHDDPMPVEPFDEQITRVLCVVAHPDDMEYGASAAVAHWTARGVEVSYLLLTHGEAGMQRTPDEARGLRAREQQAACQAVGVTDLTILDHPDGVLEQTLDLRREIARQIRRARPDAVVTMVWDAVVPWGLNQADHRVAGLSTVDAVAAAGNRWIFPELVTDEGLEPWSPTWLLVTSTAEATHALAVDQTDVDAAVASLTCHQAYLDDLPDHPKPADFIPEMLRSGGEQAGTEFAVVFRAFKLG